MKRIIAVLMVLGASCISTTVTGEGTVRLANGEWIPFQSEKLPHYGVVSHIVTEAFQSTGVTVEYGFFPWKRSFMLAKKGEWDGTFVWFRTPERAVDFLFSDPVYEFTTVFFHLKSTAFDWDTIDDLQGLKIGVSLGTIFEGECQKMKDEGKNLTCEAAPTDLSNLEKLAAGRIQVFPCDREVCSAVIKEAFSPDVARQFTYHSKPYYNDQGVILFGKIGRNSQQHVELFNRGLRYLKSSGRYDEMWRDFREGKYNIRR